MAEKKSKATRKALRMTQKKVQKTAKLGSGKRFGALEKSIEAGGKSKKAAGAIAAAIGRKKFGAKKFGKLAAKGGKKK